VLLVLQLIYSNVHDAYLHVANKAFCFVEGYNITPHELHNHILCWAMKGFNYLCQHIIVAVCIVCFRISQPEWQTEEIWNNCSKSAEHQIFPSPTEVQHGDIRQALSHHDLKQLQTLVTIKIYSDFTVSCLELIWTWLCNVGNNHSYWEYRTLSF